LTKVKELQYVGVNLAHKHYDASGLKVRTGHLKGSIQPGPVSDTPQMISASIVAGGGDAFYARAQEYGATITPKNVSFLTIPLDEAKTPMGVGRFSARQLIAHPGSYGYDGTFFQHNILFGKKSKGKGGKVVPLFFLTKSVTLPARRFMQHAAQEWQPIIVEQLDAAVAEVLHGA
jgi:hypothetical protein